MIDRSLIPKQWKIFFKKFLAKTTVLDERLPVSFFFFPFLLRDEWLFPSIDHNESQGQNMHFSSKFHWFSSFFLSNFHTICSFWREWLFFDYWFVWFWILVWVLPCVCFYSDLRGNIKNLFERYFHLSPKLLEPSEWIHSHRYHNFSVTSLNEKNYIPRAGLSVQERKERMFLHGFPGAAWSLGG